MSKRRVVITGLGIVSCLDTATGQLIWRERLGGNFVASPLMADGKLYFTSKEGVTTVFRPGREFKPLAKNQVFGETFASLAVFGESLLLRTSSTLYCFRKDAGF